MNPAANQAILARNLAEASERLDRCRKAESEIALRLSHAKIQTQHEQTIHDIFQSKLLATFDSIGIPPVVNICITLINFKFQGALNRDPTPPSKRSVPECDQRTPVRTQPAREEDEASLDLEAEEDVASLSPLSTHTFPRRPDLSLSSSTSKV
jgi:hypothetical protein